MALRGTLKDFGIADIFQLIAHQTKTGQLVLKNRDSEVLVSFREGNVVKVESTTRQKKELLGALLVRAEVLSDGQLDQAIEEQKRTLRRLGDVLSEKGLVTKLLLNEFARLQATETIYRLFTWENGTYEFVQDDVQTDPDFGEAMRAESVLMEGFRMVDEWPMIRKKITGYGMRFRVMKSLPDAPAEDLDLDDAFGEMGSDAPQKPKREDESFGESERRVHSLVESTRDVQKLIDLSRIGEFETCKALSVLLGRGYIETVEVGEKKAASAAALTGGLVSDRSLMPTIAWSALGLLVVVGAVALAVLVARSNVSLVPRGGVMQLPASVDALLARAQRERLAQALEALRLDEGKYPTSLDALVTAGFVETADLTFPSGRHYHYRLTQTGYELAPSLP